jgi:hypothetical protein
MPLRRAALGANDGIIDGDEKLFSLCSGSRGARIRCLSLLRYSIDLS